jgi:hypothetical protein
LISAAASPWRWRTASRRQGPRAEVRPCRLAAAAGAAAVRLRRRCHHQASPCVAPWALAAKWGCHARAKQQVPRLGRCPSQPRLVRHVAVTPAVMRAAGPPIGTCRTPLVACCGCSCSGATSLHACPHPRAAAAAQRRRHSSTLRRAGGTSVAADNGEEISEPIMGDVTTTTGATALCGCATWFLAVAITATLVAAVNACFCATMCRHSPSLSMRGAASASADGCRGGSGNNGGSTTGALGRQRQRCWWWRWRHHCHRRRRWWRRWRNRRRLRRCGRRRICLCSCIRPERRLRHNGLVKFQQRPVALMRSAQPRLNVSDSTPTIPTECV